jgi:hypothetical protein
MLTPIKIDNRIDAHIGIPEGIGKRPVIIHMHERYGIVQHTMDLGEKFVKAGYVTIVWASDYPPFLAAGIPEIVDGNDRCELDDEQVLRTPMPSSYLRTLPQADLSKLAVSACARPGANRFSSAPNAIRRRVVLYGAVYEADWKAHPMRPESIGQLMQEIKCRSPRWRCARQ